MKTNPARDYVVVILRMMDCFRACTIFAVMVMVIAVLMSSPAGAAPIAVRASEGVIHAYLLVRSLAGETIGQGEVIQVVKEDGLVHSHTVFNFKDGSLHDEKVVFSQQRVFTMMRYHLVQRGPLFAKPMEVSIDRKTGEYTVRSLAAQGGKEEVLTGRFDLPTDVYNGMFVVALRNLLKGTNETVSFLAFTPKPEIIKLELLLLGEEPIHIGELSKKARHYVYKPQIGNVRRFFGKFFGKLPADFHYHCWIVAAEVPTFVQFEGPLQLMGPIMRFELVSPRLTVKPEAKKPANKR